MENPVKISVCPKCNGIVRASDPDYLENNTIARNEFKTEVFDHNLSVEIISLLDYRKREWCESSKCDQK